MSRLTTPKTERNREMICRYEDCDVCEEYCPHLLEDNCLCLQEVLEKLGNYEDFAEIFEKHFSEDALKLLSDKEEFSKWLERVHWHTQKCDELGRELQAFKAKQEQGLLIELPCHIGDIIYEPTNRNTINEYMVTGIKKELFALWIEWELEKGFIYQSIYGVEVGNIGKTVFLTRSEAEEALAKMGGKA